jgi:uncharacterized protein YbjT (DUF2867 family)
MNEEILVTGGTGTLGRLVVARLRDAGRDVRVLSRHGRMSERGLESVIADLTTGDGLDAAVEGVETIMHCAGSRSGDEDKTFNLVRAASRAGAKHIVNISVVGADRVPVSGMLDRAMFGYFASKLATERVVADSNLPWTTLRATQFYELTLQVVRQMSRLPLIPSPSGFKFQPIAAAEVAKRLAELAFEPPAGLVPEMGGPQVYSMAELVRAYLQSVHRDRRIFSVLLPGKAAHAIREGAAICPDRAVGRLTWEDFLAGKTPDVGIVEEKQAA